MVSNKTATIKFRIAIIKSGLKYKDVAKKIKVSSSHLCNMLGGKDTLTKEHRAKLNELLKTNY